MKETITCEKCSDKLLIMCERDEKVNSENIIGILRSQRLGLGVLMGRRERRSDAIVEGEVILRHVVSMIQMRSEGRSHLFDLPTGRLETERLVRRARWSVSSAVDRCIAAESAERSVLDKWVCRTFLRRN